MARDYAKTNLTIWQDPEWRALPWPAQHVYKMFWEHPALSYCGVVDWRPRKMMGWGLGWDETTLTALTNCLRARHFLVVDEDTEECLVRSWVRFDGLIRQPRLAVSMCNAFGDVGSNTLRGVIVHELAKLRELEPEAAGWAKPQTADILSFPSVSAKSLPVPEDPFGKGFAIGLGNGFGSVSPSVSEAFGGNATSGFGNPYNSNSNSTFTTTPLGANAEVATTPDAAAPPAKTTKKSAATRLPDDWRPLPTHVARAQKLGVDLGLEVEKFRLHAEANDRRQANWNASFTQWLLNAKPPRPAGNVRPFPPAEDTSWMRRKP